MDKLFNFLSELFFPSFCLGCRKEGSLLCQDCKSTLDISPYNYCLCSKQPIRMMNRDGKCKRCKGEPLSGIYSALPYHERRLTRSLIYQFKYPPYIKSLAKPLAEVLVEHFVLAQNNADDIWQESVLVPVPMEKKKMKIRGYNQSEELAKELGQLIGVPLLLNNVIKIKETLPQMELSAKERSLNLSNAFSVNNPAEIKNKKIFLVDDVYTTGSTMRECARTLKSAGAKQVWGIALARES